MSVPSSPERARTVFRSWGMACAGIWAVALVIRLGHLWLLKDSPLSDVLLGDARRYHEWGIEIARGNWLGTESFYQAPLYPYFIGGMYREFGIEQTLVRIAQCVLGASACVCLAFAGRRFFSPKVGLLAGILFAFYAPAIFFDGIIQKTSLASFLTCAVLAAMASATHRPRRVWIWILLGILLGAWMLTRENALVMVTILPLWLMGDWGRATVRARALWLGLVAVGLAMVLFPVALRNRVVGGEWHLTTSQFGTNFYIGNSRYATGRYFPLLQDRGGPEYERLDATRLAEEDRGRSLTPGEVSAYWTEQALLDIRADWPGWLRLMARKWFLIWNAVEIIDTEGIYTHAETSWLLSGLLKIWHFGVLTPLAVLGAVFAWKSWRRQGVLVLFLLAYAASVSLFYVFARYRFPLVPPLMLFAAAGILRVPAIIRHRRWGRLSVGVLGLLVLGWWTNLPGEPTDPMRSNTHYMLAVHLQRMDADPQLIEREYELAEHYDPEYAEVLRMRASFEWKQGRTETALEYYERCLRLDGEFLLARYDYGWVLSDLKRPEKALEQFEHIHKTEPDFHDGWLHYRMAAAHSSLGRFADAVEHLRAARKLGRDEPEIDWLLARSLKAQGKNREALEAFDRYLKVKPTDWRMHVLAGNCHEQLGQMSDALRHWEFALELMPRDVPGEEGLRRKIELETLRLRLPPRRNSGEPNPALRRRPAP